MFPEKNRPDQTLLVGRVEVDAVIASQPLKALIVEITPVAAVGQMAVAIRHRGSFRA